MKGAKETFAALRCEAHERAIERLSKLTKAQALAVLESVPQRYWPPRPTRQDKRTITRAIFRALHGPEAHVVRSALALAVRSALERAEARR